MDHVKELSKLLTEEQVTTNQTMREQHSRDESYHIPSLPDMVIFPKRTEDVQKVINYANTYEIPVVPFGLGSSLEGNAIPYKGGISLDMSLMNQVLEVRPNDFLIKVQPGITRLQ
ncbi:2-hydroxy-acid oxidase, partial [Flavobacterium sp. IR1]